MPSIPRRALAIGCALAAVSLGSAWVAGGVGANVPSPAWQASLSNALAATHDDANAAGGAHAGLASRSAQVRADRDLARNPLDDVTPAPAPPSSIDSAATQAFSAGPPLASALISAPDATPVTSLDEQSLRLDAERKAAEAEALAAAKAKAAAAAAEAEAARLANLHRWVRPNYGSLSSPFGVRWGRMHEGIDLAGGYGSAIVAATSGTVLYAGPESGYGEVLKIADWDGTQTWYGHMSKFLVNAGDHVKPGEKIALVGAAGDATGPHLHFEVRVNGSPINPIPFLAARGIHI